MKVGVVTPAFDAARWIADAIASVIAQSHTDWAMVVVDDGSSDGTGDIARGFPDPRVTVVRQDNAGVSVARNRGLAALACDAVLFLDADDWLATDALQRLCAALDASPDAVAAYGAFAFVAERAAPGPAITVVRSGRLPSGDILRPLLERNLLANGGHALFRRAAIERAGFFRPDLAFGEDWECWIRLALLGAFAATPGREPLLFVRRRGDGAYLARSTDPAAFRPCLDAIFANPALRDRLGEAACAKARRRAEAECHWIVGRDLIRQGRRVEGRRWLRRSVAAKPAVRRAVLTVAAHGLAAIPGGWRGPFEAV